MVVNQPSEVHVFDESQTPTAKHRVESDDNGGLGASTSTTSEGGKDSATTITTTVKDPWFIGSELWLHPVLISGETAAGLVTGTPLRMDSIVVEGMAITMLSPILLSFDPDIEEQQKAEMIKFMELGIWCHNSSRPLPSSLGFYLIPVTPAHQPDFTAIRILLDNPSGIKDWSGVSEKDYGKLMIMNVNRTGSMFMLRNVRRDLNPTSQPLSGSREEGHPTYLDYWAHKWSTSKRPAIDLHTGPLLEATQLPRSFMYLHHWGVDLEIVQTVPDGALLPQSSCSWIPIPFSVQQIFRIIPTLARYLTDAYRAQCAIADLGLPLIPTNLLIEALTIPSTLLPYDNQRLETLGDAVLQVCATVHLFNAFPQHDEGQLTLMRMELVNNEHLRHCALKAGLEHFINTEVGSVNKWRYVLPTQPDAVPSDNTAHPPSRCVERTYVIRSLQDCMEALLGASYLAGGMPFALQTGSAMGLQLGGVVPWHERPGYNHGSLESGWSIGDLDAKLEIELGYKFRRNDLLRQALTHPSVISNGPSYQRLEFLGDAVFDLVVIRYLYDKFPKASSHELALPRTKAISAQTLANIAVRRLNLHEMLVCNSAALSLAIESAVPILQGISGEEIVRTGWKYNPPKALSDVFESVVGAILVDSGYDYEKTAAVVEHVMDDVLVALSPTIAKDPVTELVEWGAANGCTEIRVARAETGGGTVVLVHGQTVVGPVIADNNSLARFLAAERAYDILRDIRSENLLRSHCTCALGTSGSRPRLS